MNVIVQQIDRAMFLRKNKQWTALRAEAAEFKTVLEGIVFCIHCRTREVTLIAQGSARQDVYIYPFGGDPAAAEERRRTRGTLAATRRSKREHRVVQERLDV